MKHKFLLHLSTFLFAICSLNAFAKWDTSVSKDEMTGKVSSYAHSPIVSATKKMGFPYSGTKAWLGVGCDGKNEWAYIGFSQQPNLTNTETRDGYHRISTRIKWDDNLTLVGLTQDWGEKFIHFIDDELVIERIQKSNTVLLELNWHGNGSVYFRFPLAGSSAALKKIRSSCKQP